MKESLPSVQQASCELDLTMEFSSILLDQLCSAVIATDLHGLMTYWNRYAESLFQWQATEVLGRSIAEVLGIFVKGEWNSQDDCVARRTSCWQGEFILQRKDGSHFWAEITTTLTYSPTGEAIGIAGTVVDISDRKRNQATWETQAATLKAQAQLLDLAHDSILVVDMAGRIQFWNQGAKTLYGWDCAEVIGHAVDELLQTQFTEDSQAEIELQLMQQGRWEGELIHVCRDGWQVVVSSRWVLQHNDAGKPIAILQINNDITDRKQIETDLQQAHAQLEARVAQRTEELAATNAALQAEIAERKQVEVALQQAEAKYRSIFENAAEGIFQSTLEGRYLSANPALARIYGYSSPEVLIRELTDIDRQLYADAGQREIFLELMNHQGWVIGFESQVYRRDGSLIWISENAHAVYRSDGSIHYFEGTVADITDQREAQLQLQQQARREWLLGAISLRIRESLDLAEILERTVAEVRQFLHADRVLIYQFEGDGETGKLVAASTDAGWQIASEADHQNWHQVGWFMYSQGVPLIVDDIEQQCLSPNHLATLRRLQVRAKLVVSILQGEQCWGVIAVHQCVAPRTWRSYEIDLMLQLSVQVAIAIQQAQLFCQVQQQAQREQLLNKINRALSSSLDPETILQEIVTRTGEGFQVDRVVLYEISNCIKARNEWRSQPSIPSMLELRLPLTAWPDINDPNGTYAQRQPFHVPNYCQLPPTAGRQLEAQVYQTRSILAVPICIQGELFGSIALHTTLSERVFMPEEIQLLQRIADQAAVALYNAQSYENLEQLVQDRTQALEKEKIISEAANRAKSEFLTTMSHELRTPLNAILGLSQVLQQGLFGDLNPKQAEYVAHIHSSGDHLLCLINDILDLAKIEAGRETLAPTLISVAELCESSLALVREQAYANGLELTSAIAPAAQQVWADERRLRQMLLNLLSNAVKFTPTGRVSLNVDQHDTHISFAVIDTGIGIAPEKLSLLFQPFSQLDSQLNRQYPGSGLGLVLTRNLARLHGGDVTVTSQLGKGSEFTLILPNPPRHKLASCGLSARSPIAPAMLKPQVSSGRILIVEDDPYSALLIRDYLHAVGHQVYHLEDGYQFIQTVRQFRPNLILLDMQLADKLTGLDLLKQLQQQPELRTIPTAIVTAMAMVGDRETFLEAGASDYLSKPVDIIRLESILMKYL